MHRLAVMAVLLSALPALAQEAAPAAVDEGAKKALVSYLEAVKAKKWDHAKKIIHPKTLAVIADIKKRTGVENHPLAPGARVKESYLTGYEITGAEGSANGAVVVRTSEASYSVEEKGVEEGVAAEYFVVPIDSQWFVTDRRLGEGQFATGSVTASYKGYFQGEFELPKPPVKAGQKRKQ